MAAVYDEVNLRRGAKNEIDPTRSEPLAFPALFAPHVDEMRVLGVNGFEPGLRAWDNLVVQDALERALLVHLVPREHPLFAGLCKREICDHPAYPPKLYTSTGL